MIFENIQHINDNKNKILIITQIDESISNKSTHYSGIKGFLLAKGLIKEDFNVFISACDDKIVLHNNYYYINHDLLTSNVLEQFTYVFFCLHNDEVLMPFFKKTNIFPNLIEAKKNSNIKIINKTCRYPTIIDKEKMLEQYNMDSYDFFDFIFLQTDDTKLPSNFCKKILNIGMAFTISQFNKHCYNEGIISNVGSSEMTFDIDNISNYKIPHVISKDTINILYLGRLMGSNGMDIIYLIKLIKKLYKKYKLYIIPGSFILPNEYPQKKKSPKRLGQYLELKQFVENYKLTFNENNVSNCPEENYIEEENDYDKCNIEVLPQFPYGEHFKIIEQMDIGFGFAANKQSSKKVSEGSSKLFDYMCNNLKIIFEDGWNNTKYIEEYNFGKCIPINSKVTDAVSAIEDVSGDSTPSRYSDFLNDHSYTNRAKEILDKIISKK